MIKQTLAALLLTTVVANAGYNEKTNGCEAFAKEVSELSGQDGNYKAHADEVKVFRDLFLEDRNAAWVARDFRDVVDDQYCVDVLNDAAEHIKNQ